MYFGGRLIILLIIIGVLFVFWDSLKEKYVSTVCTSLPPENERILVPAIKSRKPLLTKSVQKIPKIIIQTNEKDLVPESMLESMKSIMDANPDYEYKYFNNKDVEKFLIENYPEKVINAYNKLKPGAYKADLFRYCILYKIGGVYIDSPMTSKLPLEMLIGPKDEFIAPEDNGTGGIYNAFICCIPGHKILERCIEYTIHNVENEIYGSGDLSVTGPKLMSRVFNIIVGPVISEKDYGNGIKLIEHYAAPTNLLCPGLTVGRIKHRGTEFFTTRYPNYYIDRIWYNTSKRYATMWKERDIFNLPLKKMSRL